MTIADDIARLRTALRCRAGRLVHECRQADPHRLGALAGTWHEMLDEIEQLQEANRWRDPAVELPEGNRHVISSWENGDVLICSAKWVTCGSGATHWRPMVDPPPAEPAPTPATVSITVDASYGMLDAVTFAEPLALVWLGATITGKYIPPGSVLHTAMSSTVWQMSEVPTVMAAHGPVTLTRRA